MKEESKKSRKMECGSKKYGCSLFLRVRSSFCVRMVDNKSELWNTQSSSRKTTLGPLIYW